ncbi:MAG: hypothetical protein M1831_005725 [Alyxoria varia]|nr:MAG: hypothetical protein M1831_005725 [Alyxoria varia]
MAASSKTPAPASPSASVLLVSSLNEILLLHRVRSSSSFPSAHVFPGGNVDEFHDGDEGLYDSEKRHEDGPAYRKAATRETFEESGILLAKDVEIGDRERNEGRKRVHAREMRFGEWLNGRGGVPDVDGLIPFTRWITPTYLPKRFTTQMYLYFLPLSTRDKGLKSIPGGTIDGPKEFTVPEPTSDGGIEHTAARFLPPSQWLSMQMQGEIILPPPQVYLLSLIDLFLKPASDVKVLEEQRRRLMEFVESDERQTPFSQMCISPVMIRRQKSDGRSVLALHDPGYELRNTNRKGDDCRVVLSKFGTNGAPKSVEVRWKNEVLAEERKWDGQHESKGKL